MLTKKTPKTPKEFVCTNCSFICFKQSEYDRHVLTQKHINTYNNLHNNNNNDEQKYFKCNCGKEYKFRQSLYTHKKTCINPLINENIVVQDSSSNEFKVLTNLVIEVMKTNTELQKQNQEFQKQLLDVCKNIQPTTNSVNSINNSTVNSNNKTFNLQFFLNEQCKDAINIKDFVQSIQIEMAHAKRVGKEGYVEGISKLIIEKLKATDIYKRPMHCSDAKRETMYIKENDVWNKDESENNEKMIRFVKDVDNKNYDFLVAHGNANPEVFDIDSKTNIPYLSMVTKSTRDHESVLKVIKKIIKEVIINKGN